MGLCESCNETSPTPVDTVNVTINSISIGSATGLWHEWKETPAVPTTVFTMDEEFEQVIDVFVGSAKQSQAQYTIVGDQITFVDAVPAGVQVLVQGVIAAP